MGNVDPAGVLRMGTPELVKEETHRIMGNCCDHKNFVISSGCDIPPMTPWENIGAFFDAVNEFYAK
jgi:uroporphyrinogen decarboxylase